MFNISKAQISANNIDSSTIISSIDSNFSELDSFTQKKFKTKFFKDSLSLVQTDTLLESNININNKKKLKIFDSIPNSPKKAALLALACPGLGQIYNKKYWKLPIVYGAMAGTIFWLARQAKQLKQYNGYIVAKENGGNLPTNIAAYSKSEIIYYRDNYRKNTQLAAFATFFVWGLSIVDAAVDAHMQGFDISDDLTMKITPKIGLQNEQMVTGINIKFNFK
ncbi:MAG: hypothetical protein H6553_12395 [Chitinophagales bacterium]|nr:hypothetical protein [Chitinophagales bacterium]